LLYILTSLFKLWISLHTRGHAILLKIVVHRIYVIGEHKSLCCMLTVVFYSCSAFCEVVVKGGILTCNVSN